MLPLMILRVALLLATHINRGRKKFTTWQGRRSHMRCRGQGCRHSEFRKMVVICENQGCCWDALFLLVRPYPRGVLLCPGVRRCLIAELFRPSSKRILPPVVVVNLL